MSHYLKDQMTLKSRGRIPLYYKSLYGFFEPEALSRALFSLKVSLHFPTKILPLCTTWQ